MGNSVRAAERLASGGKVTPELIARRTIGKHRRPGLLTAMFTLGLLGEVCLFAQLDGPASPGVSASLIRLFGTNAAFTAQAEVQILGPDHKERIGLPMLFTRLDDKIRVEVDMARMRNREQPDALARLAPLGLDRVISLICPQQRTTWVVFPKLQSVVKLAMPHAEADAFLKKAKVERTGLAKEKMEGHPCVKQRVVITDNQPRPHEATVWIATDLREFPVCVATREGNDTVMMRFRQVQFTRADAKTFEPPTGFTEYADMQALMAGAGVQYLRRHSASTPTPAKPPAYPVPPVKKK
jgi:hypothetical protein